MNETINVVREGLACSECPLTESCKNECNETTIPNMIYEGIEDDIRKEVLTNVDVV